MAEESFRGQSVRSLPRANKRYQADRTCAAPGCRTKLSIYNKWDYCWQHEPVHTYVARGKRRSRKEMEAAYGAPLRGRSTALPPGGSSRVPARLGSR